MSETALFDTEEMARLEEATPALADRIEELMEYVARPWKVYRDQQPPGPMIVHFGADISTDEEIYVGQEDRRDTVSLAGSEAELAVLLVNNAHLIVDAIRAASHPTTTSEETDAGA